MRTRRNAGDNGYRSAEDFSNEGRGYEPRNSYSDLYRSERENTDYRGSANNRSNANLHSDNKNLRENGSGQGSYENTGSNWNNENRRNDWTDNSRYSWNDNGANWGNGNRNQQNNYAGDTSNKRPQERSHDHNGYDNGSNMNEWYNDQGRNTPYRNDYNDRNQYGSSWERDNQRNENRTGSGYNDDRDENENYGNRNRYNEDLSNDHSNHGMTNGYRGNTQQYPDRRSTVSNGTGSRRSRQGFGSAGKEIK